MTMYEYKCRECAEYIDVEHGMSENPVVLCPECQASMHKVVTGGTGVIFKGTASKAKTKLRAEGERGPGWDWSRPKPNPAKGGHQLTAQERREIEDKTVRRNIDNWKGIESKMSLNEAVMNVAKSDARNAGVL